MQRRTLIQIGLSFAVAALFLFLAFRNVPLADLTAALSRFRWPWLAPAVMVSLALMLLRAWRWQLELLPLGTVPLARLWAITSVAYSAINLLPARLGEVVRPWLLAQFTQIRMTQAVGTLVVEKLMDSFSILVFLFAGLLLTAELPAWVRQAALVPALFTLAFAGIVAATYWRGETFFRRSLQPFLPERIGQVLLRVLRAVLEGMQVLPNGRLASSVFAVSLLLWSLPIVSSWILLMGFGFAVPATAALVVFIFIGFGTALPNAPGMIGTFQYACILALGLFGVSEAEALAFGLLLNALQVLTIVAQGAVGALMLGVSFAELRQVALEQAQATPEGAKRPV